MHDETEKVNDKPWRFQKGKPRPAGAGRKAKSTLSLKDLLSMADEVVRTGYFKAKKGEKPQRVPDAVRARLMQHLIAQQSKSGPQEPEVSQDAQIVDAWLRDVAMRNRDLAMKCQEISLSLTMYQQRRERPELFDAHGNYKFPSIDRTDADE